MKNQSVFLKPASRFPLSYIRLSSCREDQQGDQQGEATCRGLIIVGANRLCV